MAACLEIAIPQLELMKTAFLALPMDARLPIKNVTLTVSAGIPPTYSVEVEWGFPEIPGIPELALGLCDPSVAIPSVPDVPIP